MANTFKKAKASWVLLILHVTVLISVVQANSETKDDKNAQLRQEFEQLKTDVQAVLGQLPQTMKRVDNLLMEQRPPGPKGDTGPPGPERNVAALTARVEILERIIQNQCSNNGSAGVPVAIAAGNTTEGTATDGTTTGSGCTWVDLTSALASGKDTWVDGGLDRPGVTVHPCRVYRNGYYIPGKAATYGPNVYCYVADDDGGEHTYNENFDVLVKTPGARPSWIYTLSSFPARTVSADGQSSNPLYVAKCSHSGAAVLGYVSSLDTSVMTYGYGQLANSCDSFRILKCSSSRTTLVCDVIMDELLQTIIITHDD